MIQRFICPLAFLALSGVAHAQMPAPVVYADDDTPQAATEDDFHNRLEPSPVAENVRPLMGYHPSSPTEVSDTKPAYVSPYIPPKYVAPPPPPEPAAIRSLGPGRYMILPPESPLMTAPMATLNPAAIIGETETALPANGSQPINTPLTIAPAPVTAPPPVLPVTPAPILTQADLANKLTEMADRLEQVTAQTEAMEARAAALEASPTIPAETQKAEQPAEIKLQPITVTVPYVNDANIPGPKAQTALKKLAEQLKAAPPASYEGEWVVTAVVQAPPIGIPVSEIAQARWQEAAAFLRAQGVTLPKAPPAMVVVRAGGRAQYLKLTVRP